ncbi:MAG: YeeE/YedE family protein [Gemmatimonadota bacterium]|nr:YeeE/YedE family protein [Gemmatimonadota bacterium]
MISLADMWRILTGSWTWWVSGPLIGLMVPLLLVVGNKLFGISSNLRHLCAATTPRDNPFLRYDWKRAGGWNLVFAAGIIVGGFVAAHLLDGGNAVHVGTAARRSFIALGITDASGLVPSQLFNWTALLTIRGFIILVVGGVLVGFGTAYAGGCTSGHAIAGLADLQLPSLLAVIGFFAGGLVTTWFVLPLLMSI